MDSTTNQSVIGQNSYLSASIIEFDPASLTGEELQVNETSKPYTDSWNEPYVGFGGSINYIDTGVDDGVLIVAGRWTYDGNNTIYKPTVSVFCNLLIIAQIPVICNLV